jgi:hypothetical protein
MDKNKFISDLENNTYELVENIANYDKAKRINDLYSFKDVQDYVQKFKNDNDSKYIQDVLGLRFTPNEKDDDFQVFRKLTYAYSDLTISWIFLLDTFDFLYARIKEFLNIENYKTNNQLEIGSSYLSFYLYLKYNNILEEEDLYKFSKVSNELLSHYGWGKPLPERN